MKNGFFVNRSEWMQMKERGKLKLFLLTPFWICFVISMVLFTMVSVVTFYRFGLEHLLDFYKYTFFNAEGILYTTLAFLTLFIPFFLLAVFRWVYCVIKYKE